MTSELHRMYEALEPRRMAPRLTECLGGRGAACRVLDAKYQPGHSGILLYEYDDRLVRGDLLIQPRDHGPADPHVIAPGVRVSVFPHDADLPSLPIVMDGRHLRAALNGALDGRRALHVRLLRYRPARRATVSITSTAAPQPLIAKIYHDVRKAAAVAEESRTVTLTGSTLELAPTVAFVPELRLVVQRAMPGRSLTELIVPGRGAASDAVAGAKRAARALAELHDGPFASRRERPVAKELRRFVTRAAGIAAVDSATGDILGTLARRILEVDALLSPGPAGLVHGDCKPSQFLLDRGGRVVVLDLDSCGTGDQAGDVGTFVASIRQLAIRRGLARCKRQRLPTGETAWLAELEDAFTAAYLESRPAPALAARIRWHTAVALERKALRAFARAPRSPLAVALAREGLHCLNGVDA